MIGIAVLERLLHDKPEIAPEGTSPQAFSDACNFIDEHLPKHFNWLELNGLALDELHQILKRCLFVKEGNPTSQFDELAAYAALVPIQQQFNEAKRLHLGEDVESTGIQEKFLTSQLTAYESLTELDIKRFIVL